MPEASLLLPIDIYCERTDPGYWSEPVNALTNLSFLLAALWGFCINHRLQKQNGELEGDVLIMIAVILAGLIGIGSFLFHTHARVWSSFADVIPIWSFVAYYLFLAIYRIVGTSLFRAFRIYAIALVSIFAVLWLFSRYLLATDASEAGGDGFNGSSQYLPGMLALYGFALALHLRKHPARGWIFAAAIVFTGSIVFRTIDMTVCSNFPLGTHFLWHLLNGLFIGLLLQALVRHGRKGQS
ncbi:ceramidase domain-containing protein [uncultured Cohaesibacter sp.]|uniref:ceramidase domain-containing protein n=1 Tax=uncultured Cohaesibacter sp. TaxID=1002546 RepID=UPI0029C65AA4|nr:ceramidase domain-containing protein [uncultured Cohaesibacter sp.]